MTLRLRDIPPFPDFVEGQSDHDYMLGTWARGPLAIDRFNIVSAFSMANMLDIGMRT